MAPTAQLVTGKALGKRPRKNAQGNRAVVNYLVSTADPDYALTATGLPEIGDAYGSALPGAYVQDVAVIILGGGKASPANADQNGWSRVEVTYGPPESTGVTPDLSGWTEVVQSARGERIMYPIDPATGLPEISAPRLRNGDGVTILTGQTEAHVHTFHTGTVSTALKAYILNTLTNPCKVNDAGIVLPRYGAPGNTDSLTLAAGQALYTGHTMRQSSPGVVQLTHHLVISRDFLDREAREDADGSAESVVTNTVYDDASFVGIW